MSPEKEDNVKLGEYRKQSTPEGGHAHSNRRGLARIQHLEWGVGVDMMTTRHFITNFKTPRTKMQS